MSNTLPIIRHNVIACNKEGQRLGYVAEVKSSLASTIVRVSNERRGYNKRRAQAILRSAKLADLCFVTTAEESVKMYPKRDKLRFELVEESKDEQDTSNNLSN
jgi:hypothetical protein